LDKCPLCNQPAQGEGVGPLNDWFRINCPRCGAFKITEDGVFDAREAAEQGVSYLLSGYTRQASDAKQLLRLTAETIASLLKAKPPVATVAEQMHKLLLVISARLTNLSHHALVSPDTDYPVVFARSAGDLTYLLKGLLDRGLVEGLGDRVHPTLEGWALIDRLLLAPERRGRQAFVAMWFDPSMLLVYENGLAPGIRAAGYDPIRIDQVEHAGKIDDRIVAEIRSSSLLVADFTGQRGGVYFEAGFALGLGIPVIWTCRDTDIDKLHFDTRQYNHIVWNADRLHDLAEKLAYRIRAMAPAPG